MIVQEGINQDKIQEMNKALLLNLIREQEVCSRARLSQLSGLNKATITYLVNDFIQAKCVDETGLISTGKGRRSIGITLSDEFYYVIGIRLARTYFKIGLFNLRGELTAEKRIDIGSDILPGNVVNRIADEIQKAIEAKGNSRKLLSIGMAIPGPFIKNKGRIAVLTGRSGFEEIEFKTELEKRFNTSIIVEHDANAGAFAQLWYDREIEKEKSLIYVAAGEGIGAGIIIDGSIIRGELGTAGEIGHMTIDFNGEQCECGNKGCLENYCSVLALKRSIVQSKKRKYNLSQIKQMIADNDSQAVIVYRKACCFLGYGIVNVVNSFNPSTIILGDELSHIESTIMLEEINSVLEKRLLKEVYQNLSVKISGAVRDSVLHGIGAMCLEHAFSNYSIFFKIEREKVPM